jgi:hypothetical protein
VKIRCPFHPDEEPSCSVNLAKRLFHCFACHAAGNALKFVHRMEARGGSSVTLRQAGITLAGICGEERPAGGEAKAHQGRQEGRGEAAKGGTAPTTPAGSSVLPGVSSGTSPPKPGSPRSRGGTAAPTGSSGSPATACRRAPGVSSGPRFRAACGPGSCGAIISAC